MKAGLKAGLLSSHSTLRVFVRYLHCFFDDLHLPMRFQSLVGRSCKQAEDLISMDGKPGDVPCWISLNNKMEIEF